MRISPQLLCNPDLELLTFEGLLRVQSPDLRSLEMQVSCHEAFALAVRNEIEAICTSSGRVKYFRRLTAAERPDPRPVADKSVKSPCGQMGAALQTFYEEEINGSRVGTLMKSRGAGMVKWSDKDGFNPKRFNPDRIPKPLMVLAGVPA